MGILEDMAIEDLSDSLVSELPVAAQKKVTMATAIGSAPKLLLLDEVAAGFEPQRNRRNHEQHKTYS